MSDDDLTTAVADEGFIAPTAMEDDLEAHFLSLIHI